MFFDDLDKFAENPAVIDRSGKSHTYANLVSFADRFGAKLNPAGHQLLFILCRNNIESLSAYLGSLRSGNAAVLLSADTDRQLLARLVDHYRPDYIWKPIDFDDPGNSNRANDDEVLYRHGDYMLVARNIERTIEINQNLSLLLSTSGSTGSPKMVRLTAANIEANAASIATYLELTADERPITSLPMHYSFGLSVINSHLKVGACLILTNDSIISRPFWNSFKERRATSFSGVPYTYEMLRRMRFADMKLPSLRVMTQAGGKLAPAFAKEFSEMAHQRGIRFFIMYGQTEATARISYLPPSENLTRYDSMGIAIPGGELFLINESGQRIEESGIEGELVYRGSNVMMGYAEQEVDLALGDELGGLLHTGDIARVDSDGYFYITGRMKRFIKLFGNRVNLDEVEQMLKAEGCAVACGGRDDLLCIATTEPESVSSIERLLAGKLGFHHTSFKVLIVNCIPRNTSGKIQYAQMFESELA